MYDALNPLWLSFHPYLITQKERDLGLGMKECLGTL